MPCGAAASHLASDNRIRSATKNVVNFSAVPSHIVLRVLDACSNADCLALEARSKGWSSAIGSMIAFPPPPPPPPLAPGSAPAIAMALAADGECVNGG